MPTLAVKRRIPCRCIHPECARRNFFNTHIVEAGDPVCPNCKTRSLVALAVVHYLVADQRKGTIRGASALHIIQDEGVRYQNTSNKLRIACDLGNRSLALPSKHPFRAFAFTPIKSEVNCPECLDQIRKGDDPCLS